MEKALFYMIEIPQGGLKDVVILVHYKRLSIILLPEVLEVKCAGLSRSLGVKRMSDNGSLAESSIA